MDAHAHTHTPRKKWRHYFWEFLMLFLAVFCGFLAENYREHVVEKRREKTFVKSLVEDLKMDTASFQRTYLNNDSCLSKMDSLIYLLKSPDRNVHTSQLYYLARMAIGVTIPYAINDRTFSQMKSSGNLRLIETGEIADSITSYYYGKIELIKRQNDIWIALMEDYIKKVSVVFDASVFQQMQHERIQNKSRNLPLPAGNPPLASENPELIMSFMGSVHFLYTRTRGMRDNATVARTSAINLINLLQKNYHLKKE
jgi:hypothetical protein